MIKLNKLMFDFPDARLLGMACASMSFEGFIYVASLKSLLYVLYFLLLPHHLKFATYRPIQHMHVTQLLASLKLCVLSDPHPP